MDRSTQPSLVSPGLFTQLPHALSKHLENVTESQDAETDLIYNLHFCHFGLAWGALLLTAVDMYSTRVTINSIKGCWVIFLRFCTCCLQVSALDHAVPSKRFRKWGSKSGVAQRCMYVCMSHPQSNVLPLRSDKMLEDVNELPHKCLIDDLVSYPVHKAPAMCHIRFCQWLLKAFEWKEEKCNMQESIWKKTVWVEAGMELEHYYHSFQLTCNCNQYNQCNSIKQTKSRMARPNEIKINWTIEE